MAVLPTLENSSKVNAAISRFHKSNKALSKRTFPSRHIESSRIVSLEKSRREYIFCLYFIYIFILIFLIIDYTSDLYYTAHIFIFILLKF